MNSKFLKPRDTKSRDVTEKDIPRVIKDAEVLHKLCLEGNGPYKKGFAIAHSQVVLKDPLRFFVTDENEIVINPVITRHTRHTVDSPEGCLTFPKLPGKKVQRYNKCEVDCYTIEKGKLSEKKHLELSGLTARVFQHEIDHFEGVYIYE